MKATQSRKISILIIFVSSAMLVMTVVLPGVKTPQVVSSAVAPTPQPPGGYEIYGYGIPPVVQGTSVNVTFSRFLADQLQYSLAPTKGSLTLNPIAFGQVGHGPVYNVSAVAGGSYSLELMVIAYNGSGYSITYSGVWSPYDFLQVYISPLVFVLAAGLAGTYYFGTRIPRQMNEEEVMEELERERRSKTRGPRDPGS